MTIHTDYYTKQEVAELLNIAESTVYTLAKKNKIEVEVLPPGVSRPKRYTQQSVIAFKNEHQEKPNGLSIHELASKYQVSKQRIYQWIKRLELHTETAIIDKRQCLVLAVADEAILAEALNKKTHKGATTDFYQHLQNIALFQLFKTESGEQYRITRNEQNEWGIHVALTNEFVLFEEAVTRFGLIPVYTIHQDVIANTTYINFRFPMANREVYPFIDQCYANLGVENMHLVVKQSELLLAIKAEHTFLSVCETAIDYLNSHCENAVIEPVDGELQFTLLDKPVTVILREEIHLKLKQLATEENKSFSDIINELLKKQLS